MKKLLFIFTFLICAATYCEAQSCCNGYVLYAPLNYTPGFTTSGYTDNSVCKRSYNDTRFTRNGHTANPISIYTGTITPSTSADSLAPTIGSMYVNTGDTSIYIKMSAANNWRRIQ